MSGELHPRVESLMSPDKASKLLDDILYERVLRCVDLEALFMIEVDLWVALSECDDAGDDAGDEAAKLVAKEMIDRALRRLTDEERRYGMMRPFGMDCPDCEDELLDNAKQKRGRKSG